jgi:UDP-N-acetylmuramyl pentapeptide phosphotransferase/UDP-N-acetylglucosamine-1-phosphate transferase
LFLGDVGSLPIGLLLAWLLIVLAGAGHFAAALLFPLYYLADATITLLRRAWKRERVWEAHRSHFYQRATGRGLSVLRVVTGVFLTNAVLALLALASIVLQQWAADLIALALGSAAVAGLLCWFARGRP